MMCSSSRSSSTWRGSVRGLVTQSDCAKEGRGTTDGKHASQGCEASDRRRVCCLVSQNDGILHISSARDSQGVGRNCRNGDHLRCLLPHYPDQPCLSSTSANLVTPVSQSQALQKELYNSALLAKKTSRALEACSCTNVLRGIG